MNFCIAGYLRVKSSKINAIWFIKTNFLEGINYFRLSIGAIVLFEIFTLVGSQNWKKSYVDAKEEPIYLYDTDVYEPWSYRMTLYTYDPLKQTKRTLWCLARLTINLVSGCFRRFSGKFLKQTEPLKKHSAISLVGNFQAEIRISCLQSFFLILVSGFRGRFSLNETDLGKW